MYKMILCSNKKFNFELHVYDNRTCVHICVQCTCIRVVHTGTLEIARQNTVHPNLDYHKSYCLIRQSFKHLSIYSRIKTLTSPWFEVTFIEYPSMSISLFIFFNFAAEIGITVLVPAINVFGCFAN